MYNKYSTDFKHQQVVVDEGVVMFNQTLNLINMQSEVVTPWLQDTIHFLTKGKRIDRYSKLRDGIHPTSETADTWARLIAKSALTNLAKAAARHWELHDVGTYVCLVYWHLIPMGVTCHVSHTVPRSVLNCIFQLGQPVTKQSATLIGLDAKHLSHGLIMTYLTCLI